MKRIIQSAAGPLVATFLMLAPALRAEVACGDNRDSVIRELGYAAGRTAMGTMEILTYGDGTTVTLDKGVVVEIARKGRIIGLQHAEVPVARPKAPADAGSGSTWAELRPAHDATNNFHGPDAQSGSTSAELRLQPTPPPLQPAAAKPDVSKPKVSPLPGPATTLADDGKKRTTARSTTPYTRSPPVYLWPRQVTPGNHTAAGVVTVVFLVAFVTMVVAFFVFMSYCLKRICLKAGEDPGILIWIPIAQMIPLLRIAQLPELLLLLILVPIVNFVFILVLWAKVCSALGKNPWLVLVLLLPVLNLLLIPYLAFCSGGSEAGSSVPAPIPTPVLPQSRPPQPEEALAPTT